MLRNTIWVTGASGRVGKELIKHLKNRVDYKLIGTDLDVDVTDLSAVESAMDIYKPGIIINCASLSDAAYCQDHKEEAFRVNALGARNLAIVSRQHDIKLIQLSTDDVFSGESNRSKSEFDVPTPRTIYGQSKLAGENFVRELNPKHVIVRSSWVYGEEGKDYLGYVLSMGKEGKAFEAPVDRVSSPTSTEQIALFIESILDKREYGVFHASCEGACTRLQYARAVLTLAGYDANLAVEKYSDGNAIVATTLLDNLMLRMTGVYEMPQWMDELKKHVKKED